MPSENTGTDNSSGSKEHGNDVLVLRKRSVCSIHDFVAASLFYFDSDKH